MRIFGCRVFPYLRDYTKNKLQPRSTPCIFIGYSPKYKGFRCLEPSSGRVYTTRHAKFDEDVLPFHKNLTTTNTTDLPITNFEEQIPTPATHPTPSPTTTASSKTPTSCLPICDIYLNPTPQPLPINLNTPIQSPPNSPASSPSTSTHSNPQSNNPPLAPTHTASSSPSTAQLPPTPSSAPTPSTDSLIPPPSNQDHQQPPQDSPTAPSTSTQTLNSHPMTTRAKDGIFKPKHFSHLAQLTTHPLHQSLFSSHIPKGIKTALKNPKWIQAMDDELKALHVNQTWTLVPRPTSTNIIGSKWIYRIKYNSNGSIDRYKARLVAQGFTQIPGLNFSHTFSPVVKSSTIRVVLSLATINNWTLRQLDVNNAFLNGHLTETIFMEQPPGFEDSNRPNHVCKLNRALYGLKQAPHAWFQRLSSFLLNRGFQNSRADTSVFIYNHQGILIYLLVYVDDIILTGNNEKFIHNFTSCLNKEFKIKDLGSLNFFLGLEVHHTKSGLFLNQSKYAHDILTRAGLLDSKPVATPLTSKDIFTSEGQPFHDPTLYRSLVGALQYLTITRPDLSYVVNQASQFLQTPTTTHFQLVKRILRYMQIGLDVSTQEDPLTAIAST
ncbi:putative RNA-directed DNA polymerase [Helianthus anomalus]